MAVAAFGSTNRLAVRFCLSFVSLSLFLGLLCHYLSGIFLGRLGGARAVWLWPDSMNERRFDSIRLRSRFFFFVFEHLGKD